MLIVNYRRNKIAGGTYFFTVTLRDRRSKILVEHIALLLKTWQKIRAENPYEITEVVILPEHIHAIWKLPDNCGLFIAMAQNQKLFYESIDAKRN